MWNPDTEDLTQLKSKLVGNGSRAMSVRVTLLLATFNAERNDKSTRFKTG